MASAGVLFINIKMIFHDTAKGRTITLVIQLDDEPGLLSVVLKTVAEFHANILTIHQSIPINGIASLTLSVDVLPQTGDVAEMLEHIEEQEGIHYVKRIRHGRCVIYCSS